MEFVFALWKTPKCVWIWTVEGTFCKKATVGFYDIPATAREQPHEGGFGHRYTEK